MVSALLVSSDKDFLMDLDPEDCRGLDLNISRARSGNEGILMVLKKQYDLVVSDEFLFDMTGLQLIKILVGTNHRVHCAVVSSLFPNAFHEKSEGLGILMQIRASPGKNDIKNLLQHLNRILNSNLYS